MRTALLWGRKQHAAALHRKGAPFAAPEPRRISPSPVPGHALPVSGALRVIERRPGGGKRPAPHPKTPVPPPPAAPEPAPAATSIDALTEAMGKAETLARARGESVYIVRRDDGHLEIVTTKPSADQVSIAVRPAAARPDPKVHGPGNPTPPAPKGRSEPSPLAGDGTDVGDHVDMSGLSNQRLRAEAQRAMNAIARVHKDGALPNITTKQTRGNNNGLYSYAHGLIHNDQVRMNPRAAAPAVTMAHELGHFQDMRGLGDGNMRYLSGTPAGEDSGPAAAAMRDFLDVARRSATIQRGNTAYANQKRYRAYWTSDIEVWARAYSQFITQRGGDPEMKRQLATRVGNSLPQEWPEDDFAPLDAAVEKVLRAQGLM